MRTCPSCGLTEGQAYGGTPTCKLPWGGTQPPPIPRGCILSSSSLPDASQPVQRSDAPLVSEIEEFRREHYIEAHPDGKPGLAEWAIQHNRILNYLCYRACTPLPEIATPKCDDCGFQMVRGELDRSGQSWWCPVCSKAGIRMAENKRLREELKALRSETAPSGTAKS